MRKERPRVIVERLWFEPAGDPSEISPQFIPAGAPLPACVDRKEPA